MDYLGHKGRLVVMESQGHTAYQDNPAVQEREVLRETREIEESEDTQADQVCVAHVIFIMTQVHFTL